MNKKLFEGLKAGLEEAIAHQQGKINLRTESIEIPEPPKKYRAKAIKGIREQNKYSQGVFAKVLNVSVKTIQSWESGQRAPSHAASRLLEIVDKGIYPPKVAKRK